EVDGICVAERRPGQRVGGVRHEPPARHRDRALVVVVDEGEAAPLRLGPPRHVHRHALARQPIRRAPTVLVVAYCGEEVGRAREPGEDDRGHGPTAAGGLPRLGGVQDLAGHRNMRHPRELHPFDVTDDGDAHAGEVSHRLVAPMDPCPGHRVALLDWLACAARGATEPAARAARAAGDGLLDRVVFAGTAGHVLDFDDTYLPGLAHLSAPTAPAALVLAAALDRSIGDALAAYTDGFEAMG